MTSCMIPTPPPPSPPPALRTHSFLEPPPHTYLGFESYPFLWRAYSVSGRGRPTALTGRRMRRRELPASSRRGMSQADASSFHCARRSTLDTSSGGTKFVITTYGRGWGGKRPKKGGGERGGGGSGTGSRGGRGAAGRGREKVASRGKRMMSGIEFSYLTYFVVFTAALYYFGGSMR